MVIMKKSAIALFVLAALFLVGSLSFISSGDIVYFIGGIIIAAVFAFLGYRSYATNKAKEEKQRQEEAELAEKRKQYAETHMRVDFSVAGVTYENEDGSSRQAILKRMAKEDFVVASLGEFEYDGSPAVAVMLDDERIGSVPKEHLPDVLPLFTQGKKLSTITADIEDFEDEDGKTIYRCDISLSREI